MGNRVYAATENNTVYALNARNGQIAWKRHLGTPVQASTLPCGEHPAGHRHHRDPGDLRLDALYAVAFLSGYRHVLFGLSLRGGKVVLKRKPADAPGSDPRVHQQSALALSVSQRSGLRRISAASTGDCGDYKGRVVSVRAQGKRAEAHLHRRGHPGGRDLGAVRGGRRRARATSSSSTGNGDNTSGFDSGNSVHPALVQSSKQTGFYRARPTPPSSTRPTPTWARSGPHCLAADRMFVIGKEGLGLTALDGATSEESAVSSSRQRVCGGGAFGGLAYLAPLLSTCPCTDGLVRSPLQRRLVQRPPGRAMRPTRVRPSSPGRRLDDRHRLRHPASGYAPDSGRVLATSKPRARSPTSRRQRPAAGRLFAPADTEVIAFAGI